MLGNDSPPGRLPSRVLVLGRHATVWVVVVPRQPLGHLQFTLDGPLRAHHAKNAHDLCRQQLMASY